jgi:hypothetical protein
MVYIHIMKEFFHIPRPSIRISKNVYREKGVMIGREGFGYERNEKEN